MPLLAGCIQGGGWVAADIRVTQGTFGIGVLNRKGNEVLISGPAAASDIGEGRPAPRVPDSSSSWYQATVSPSVFSSERVR